MSNELKYLDLNVANFKANGKNYVIETSMSIERYCEFEIMNKELSFGMTFEAMIEKLKQLHRMLNKSEFVNSAVLIDQMVRGIAKIKEREPIALKICTLFINEVNEDRSKWSADMATQKIEDWKVEGIAADSFFALAASSVNGFLSVLNKLSQANTKEGSSAIESL